ncbi:hypothetical protein [Companilactobacillus kimchiensis]|uniref:PTS EIIA type-2 domain-containing protein n=1 Tax=Companilactobacillus kimchiensis TaxID=993692 RepID=A0A0R2LN06_9LACO|nr:hypothetical protein [Companilactobacillus kimchiensis]KRO00834.1 hypothetical protein IV57_GL000155 [Companilactobacillus kimchiensis]
MKSIVNERFCTLNANNITSLNKEVYKIVNFIEPTLKSDEIQRLIDKRNQLGDGLVNDDSLIIHVISKKVLDNIAIYGYLRKTIYWNSEFTNISVNLKKIVILVVNPNLKKGELINLEAFINNEKINNVKKLVMG